MGQPIRPLLNLQKAKPQIPYENRPTLGRGLGGGGLHGSQPAEIRGEHPPDRHRQEHEQHGRRSSHQGDQGIDQRISVHGYGYSGT